MLLACVFYALAACLCVAVCVTSNPLLSFKISRRSTTEPTTNEGGIGRGREGLTEGSLAFDTSPRKIRSPLRNVHPVQAALLPTAPSNRAVERPIITTVLPFITPTAIPTPSPVSKAFELVAYSAASSTITETPFFRTQLRRKAPENVTTTSHLRTTIRETTTVYVNSNDCTGTPTPTAAMSRYSVPISDAGQKGGIAGGTVGAVLIVAVLTLFCYRRVRRRTRQREGFMSLSDSSSTPDDAERGMVARGGLFGSENKTASAAESFTTDAPQITDPSVVTTAQGSRTSEQVPICFRPSRRLVSRYPSLPVTPRASIRLSDYLNPVIRETVLLPRPLRLAGRTAPARSLSWQAMPRKQPTLSDDVGQQHADLRADWRGGSGTGTGSASRSKSMTATHSSSMYSSDATFDFAEYVTIGARTSRATTTQRASGTTDGSGLRSTLANFPRPPPYTFSRGDGRGLGTSWRESFVFSTPDDEVLLAFPKLARQIEEDLH